MMTDTINTELQILGDQAIQELGNADCDALDAEWLEALYRSLADPRCFGPDYDDAWENPDWADL